LACGNFLNTLKIKGIKPGLSRTRAMLDDLGNPQKTFKAIHIAGTNGKGSTCAIIASILQEAGYKVGLYTSPELIEFNDRIKVNGVPIEDYYIDRFCDEYSNLLSKNNTSYFEAVTCLAFNYFKDRKVDYAVLETGMGGRFDATNVVDPEVFGITKISEDHKKYLGDTILKIAREKAGIIKEKSKGVTGRQDHAVLEIIRKVAVQERALLDQAPDNIEIKITDETLTSRRLEIKGKGLHLEDVNFHLAGDFQLDNLKIAVNAILLLDNRIRDKDLKQGVERTKLRGRFEVVQKEPPVYFDVAHNPGAIEEVLINLRKIYKDTLIKVIIALKSDKDYSKIGHILARFKCKVFLYVIHDRNYYDSETLYNNWHNQHAGMVTDIVESFKIINNKNRKEDVVWLITGTHGLAKKAYNFFNVL
jgi:dihydrofolate synthase/folylpolyglutamate synthase